MRIHNIFLTSAAVMAIIFSAAACSGSLNTSTKPDVDKLLREAHLSEDYWHKEISDGGVEDGTQIWFVNVYKAPEIKNEEICVSAGNSFVINQIQTRPNTVSIKSSEVIELMYLPENSAITCADVPSSNYFLVEPAAPYTEVLSVFKNIRNSVTCVSKSISCDEWKSVKIDSDYAKNQLVNDFDKMMPFSFEKKDNGEIIITYRYETMDHFKNYLVFHIRTNIGGGSDLEINIAPYEVN